MPTNYAWDPRHGVGVTSGITAAAAQLSTVMREGFPGDVEQVIYRKNVAYNRIAQNTDVRYNEPIITKRLQVAEFGGLEAFDDQEPMVMNQQSVFDTASWKWFNLRVPVYLRWADMVQTMNNPLKMAELSQMLTDAAGNQMKDTMAYLLYHNPNRTSALMGQTSATVDGSSTDVSFDSVFGRGPNGLSEMVREDPNTASSVSGGAEAAQTYGGFIPSTYPTWINQSHPGSGYYSTQSTWYKGRTIPISSIAIQTVVSACEDLGRGDPDLILTTRNVYNQFYQLFQNQQMLQVTSRQEVGYKALVINGVEMIHDPHVPSYADSPKYITYGANGGTLQNPLYYMAAVKDGGSHPGAETSFGEYCYILTTRKIHLTRDGNVPTENDEFEKTDITGQMGFLCKYVFRGCIWTDDRASHGVIRFASV